MVKSGWFYSYGLGFWGANGHDGVWHIALAESLARRTFAMPVFAGLPIQNYHIGFDLFLAILNKISFIPVTNLYFQILPPIFAFLIGLLTYKFTKNLWSVFFIYFGGSLGWLIGRGESAFWSQQAISTLINPPFAMSLVLILLGLIFIQKRKYFWASLCFGILIEIKIYAGLLVLGGLLLSTILEVIRKKDFTYTKTFLSSLLISLVLFFFFEKGSQSLIIFQPFWFLETLMGLADRLNYQKFYSAMLTYRSGHVWLKMGAAYSAALLIFILGNFGTRIVFLFRKIKFDELNIFIYSIIIAGLLIPMLFLQKGTPWNTIQFFYYSLFFASILAGQVIHKTNRYLLIAIVLLTIPTTIFTLKDVYIPSRPPAMLSKDEISALSFLSKEPQGVVLTQPFDQAISNAAVNNPPRPLYLYASTAYVSAFSSHQTFMEDEENLDIMGYNWQPRREEVVDWFKENDNSLKREFLIKNNIKYIYWIKMGQSPLDLGKLGLKNIYENNLVIIYATI